MKRSPRDVGMETSTEPYPDDASDTLRSPKSGVRENQEELAALILVKMWLTTRYLATVPKYKPRDTAVNNELN